MTVTGFSHYYGVKVFKIGSTIHLVKDHDNEFDSEAISAEIPGLGKVGFVSNSYRTKANGTSSAGFIYNMFDESCTAVVRFTTQSKVIAQIISTDRAN